MIRSHRIDLLGVAMAAASSGVWLAAHHDVSVAMAAAVVALGLVLAMQRSFLWLFVVAALLPCLNFAPWTGWQGIDEFDLLVLGVLAGGYARLGWMAHRRQTASPGRVPSTPGDFSREVILLVLGLSLIGLCRGWADGGSQPFGWFQSQLEPINSLRVFKGPVLAVLALPLLHDALRRDAERASLHFASGMAAGLMSVVLATLWERTAYPGLMNLSSHYRTVGMFWEMNVGGAALDVYLSAAMPFAVWLLMQARSPSAWIGAASVLLLASYAVLITFSRGVWLTVVLTLLLLVALLLRRHFEPTLLTLAKWLAAGVAAILIAVALLLMAMAAGPAAVLATAAVMAGITLWLSRSMRLSWHATAGIFLCLLICTEVAAVAHFSDFASDRVAASASDFGSRWEHWRRGIELLETPVDWALGLGLGRFPVRYAHASPEHGFPGRTQLVNDPPTQTVRLVGPDANHSGNGWYALTQRVPMRVGSHVVRMSLSSATAGALSASLCELHLLYPRVCQSALVHVRPSPSGQQIEIRLRGGELSTGKWFAPRRAAFMLSALTPGSAIDVKEVRLASLGVTGAADQGEQLLRNGDFSEGQAYWLPVAMNRFLPWHTDSLYLELLIERGLLGLLVLGGGAVWWCSLSMQGRIQLLPLAPFFSASGAAVLIIGLVSSVLDSARSAFLSTFLLCWLGLAGALHARRAIMSHPDTPSPT